jgi:predicted CoA-binding protein
MEETQKEGLISDFVNLRVWAVVGASQDRSKYGNRIFRSLRDAGYTVYAVNPKGGKIDGAQVYASLADLPELPEVVDTVVPPAVTENIVREMHELGLRRVWMQPGSQSDGAISYGEDNDIQVVHDACAMVHKRFWS